MAGRRGTTHNTNKEYRWHSLALTHRNILPFSPINKRAIDLTSLFVMISRAVNAIKKWPCFVTLCFVVVTWWRHQMETFSTLLALCAGNSPVTGEFPAQRPVTWNFDVFFDLRLNERLSKQSCGWWFEMLSRPLWRHCNVSYQILWMHVIHLPISFRVAPLAEGEAFVWLPSLVLMFNNNEG